MTVVRSVLLFVLAALAEIGGAWLVWQGVREHRGWLWVGAGVVALGLYGFVATLQPDAHFGRILAAYGGVFVVGSLLWGVVLDGFRPDRFDLIGAALCLVGVVVIMYAPRWRGLRLIEGRGTIAGVSEPVRPEDLRVSDAERQAVADRLRVAQEVGQLDIHEFDERVRSVWAARTRGELERVTADLPAPPPRAAAPARRPPGRCSPTPAAGSRCASSRSSGRRSSR